MLVRVASDERIASGTARAPGWLLGLFGVLFVGFAYGLLQGGMRLLMSANLPQDDVTANILAQTLEPGYLPRQPPLYEWLLWTVQRLTGPTLPSFLLIKYGLLTAAFGFLYLAATRIFKDPRWAMLAGLSPLLLYQIGWNLHEGVTHTMVLIACVAASFWAFIRAVEQGRAQDYLLFGLFIGLGMISKWSFAAFVLALLSSAMLQPRLRKTIFNWRILLSVGASILVASPAIYWVVAGNQDLAAVYGQAVAPMASESRFKATLIGLGLSIFAPLAFLFPLDVILVAMFPRMVRQAALSIRAASPWNAIGARDEVDWPRLILHMTLAGFSILMLGALLTGATHYLERYMHPFFLLTPIWLLAMVERTGNASRKAVILGVVLAAATVSVLPLRFYDLLHAMGPECKKCRVAIPYDGLAKALSERGFVSGTIIAQSRHDAGNLRRYFPNARIVCLETPRYAPPFRDRAEGQVAVVLKSSSRPRYLHDAVRQAEEFSAEISNRPEMVTMPWRPWPPSAAERSWSWSVLVADLGAAKN